MTNTIHVDASPDACWAVLGERFADIGTWATAIVQSRMDQRPAVGATRVCTVRGFGGMGDMDLHEELIAFDASHRTFTYRVIAGQPKLMRAAQNQWTIESDGRGGSVITSRARLRLAWYMLPLTPLFKARLRADARRVFEELAHVVEHGRPHPRKAASTQGMVPNPQ